MYPYKVVLIASMPRSASMWTFNVVREMFRRAGTAALPDEVPIDEQVTLETALKAVKNNTPSGMYVLKTHQRISAFPQARFIGTHRDVRDAMISFMRFMNCDFERALESAVDMAELSDHFRRFPNEVSLQMEYIDIKSQPLDTAGSIMDFLGLQLPRAELEAIVEKYSKRNVRQLIETMEEGVDMAKTVSAPLRQGDTVLLPGATYMRALDTATGFQSGHVSDYEDGDWQSLLSPAQIKAVRDKFGAWLDRNGY